MAGVGADVNGHLGGRLHHGGGEGNDMKVMHPEERLEFRDVVVVE